jgi:hypothetical protein
MQNTTVIIDPTTLELIEYIALQINQGHPELWEGNTERLVRMCIPTDPTPGQPFHFPATDGLVAVVTEDNRLRVFLEVNGEGFASGDGWTLQ